MNIRAGIGQQATFWTTPKKNPIAPKETDLAIESAKSEGGKEMSQAVSIR